jgi:hypothetical protein
MQYCSEIGRGARAMSGEKGLVGFIRFLRQQAIFLGIEDGRLIVYFFKPSPSRKRGRRMLHQPITGGILV